MTTLKYAPDGSHQREGVIGIAYRPRRSVEIAIERRIGLDRGGRDAWQFRVAGGGEWTIGRWRIEGYGQAGLTGLRRRDGFVEGQGSVRRTVMDRGGLRISAGGGIWGGAQPGVRRLDLGPHAVAEFKLGLPVRISADYRISTLGKVRPASGPALTLSTSF